MSDSELPPRLASIAYSVIMRAVMFALVGAVLGGIVGWVGFGGVGYNAATGRYGWGLLMAPTFALSGASVAGAGSLLASALSIFQRRFVDRTTSGLTVQDELNDAEWKNPANWFGGLLYRSRLDTRTFVPKRKSVFGHTINLANPVGLAIVIALAALLLVTGITSAFR